MHACMRTCLWRTEASSLLQVFYHQSQANRWVKALEGRSGLRSVRLGDANFLRVLESCIRIGARPLCNEVHAYKG